MPAFGLEAKLFDFSKINKIVWFQSAKPLVYRANVLLTLIPSELAI
jgi:hypothetical protein